MITLPSALRRGVAPLLLLALVSACAGAPSPSGVGTVRDGALTVTADDLAFDIGTIRAPADTAFTITLVNNDSVPHNISLYVEEGGEEIVIGDVINQGETVEVAVPALDAGTYFFICDLHPDMNGSVVVEDASSG